MTESSDGHPSDKNPKPVLQQVTPHTAQFPFDEVVVAEGGTRRNLSPSEFFALPLAQRIQYVVQQNASFFAGGQPVDSREVLKQMRTMRARLH